MMTMVFFAAAAAFVLAYFFYGGFLKKRFGLDDSRPTPSHTDYDGVDRVPAHKAVLLGHHFSSIAGAGPIVGPIIAATAFGWGPTLLWVVLGAIFIGGVHDFSALVASIRHRARSIAEFAKERLTPLSFRLLLTFIWLALVYVLVVFTDLTAASFKEDGGVASSSLMFILLAVGFGFFVYRLKIPVLWSSLIFVPLVFIAVWLGQIIPLPASSIPLLIAADPAKTWAIILLLYCFVASVTPVWILLQPRDYLSSYLLYSSVLGGLLGILIGGFALKYPAFIGWHVQGMGSVFPILFITVACGACSGFHAVVASGTSSKQLNKESDAKLVGYGAMLIEGMVAVIALSTVMILAADSKLLKDIPVAKLNPMKIYSVGMGNFLSKLGLPVRLGESFGLLAIATFILTTLDTATRLGRYIFEEFFGWKNPKLRYLSSLATLVLPTIFVLIPFYGPDGKPLPAYKAIWPVFGASNQLLAALALLVIVIWMRSLGKKTGFLVVPMGFMLVMTLWALVLLIGQYKFSVIGIIAIVLMMLALMLVFESARIFLRSRRSLPAPVNRS